MNNVLGVINLVSGNQFLNELTNHRCLASVPFAGRYRLIDFTLSNFIHAGITQVGVLTKEKYRSIMDHLGSGKEWDLDRRIGGLTILPPLHPEINLKGDLHQFYDQIEFFERSLADTIIISPGHHVAKINYNEMLMAHKKSHADITVIYKDYQGKEVDKPKLHQCILNEDDQVIDINLFTSPRKGDHVCLDSFIMDKQLFIHLVQKCIEANEYDFIKDVVKANLHQLYVKGVAFKGELNFIHSIGSYYTENMRFLNPDVIRSYFYNQWDVYTKIKHEAPARYAYDSNVSNSLIANGCYIEGTVENSILFRGVKIHRGAIVKNSIIMQKSEIHEGAYIENLILDKQATITKGQILIGDEKPMVVKKALTV